MKRPALDTGGMPRVLALDGLRGLAILPVMLTHFVSDGDMTPVSKVDEIVSNTLSFGWVGVEVFFVLSGFLITGILLDSLGAPHYFRNFYIRRTLRIFPLYYGFLALWLGRPAAVLHVAGRRAEGYRDSGESRVVVGISHQHRPGTTR